MKEKNEKKKENRRERGLGISIKHDERHLRYTWLRVFLPPHLHPLL